MGNEKSNDGYRRHKLDQESTLTSLVSTTDRMCADLEHKTSLLPIVDAKGNSECPFAEDQYYAKEELARQLRTRVSTLHVFLDAVTKEIERCRRNRSVLRGQEVRLPEVAGWYNSAESAQAAEENRVLCQHDLIRATIDRAERALASAETRKFPGREPRRQPQFGPASSVGGGATSKNVPGVNGDRGVSDLVTLDMAARDGGSSPLAKPAGKSGNHV